MIDLGIRKIDLNKTNPEEISQVLSQTVPK